MHEGAEVQRGGAHVHSANNKTTGSAPSGTTGVTGSGMWITPNSHSHTGDFNIGSGGTHDHTIGTSGAAGSLPPYKRLYWIARQP